MGGGGGGRGGEKDRCSVMDPLGRAPSVCSVMYFTTVHDTYTLCFNELHLRKSQLFRSLKFAWFCKISKLKISIHNCSNGGFFFGQRNRLITEQLANDINRLTSHATFNTFHDKVSLSKKHQTHRQTDRQTDRQ